jgi:hypothetical protein
MEFVRYLIYDLGFLICLFTLAITLILFGLKKRKSKIIFFNLSAIPLALILFELFKLSTQQNNETVYSGTYLENNITTGEKDFLGYGPKSDTSFQANLSRKNNDTLVFNALYSFKDGHRTTPNNSDTSKYKISLLGGSHLFGEGLNDNQTIAYYLNNCSESPYNITNYAFNGYGTHQALYNLENNILTQSNKPKVVIYYFITDHIFRSAGKALWDSKGPLYEMENNELLYKGGFDENKFIKPNYITKRLKIIWQNSQLYQTFFLGKYSEKDIIRVREMIKKMNTLLKKENIKFIFLAKKDADTTIAKNLEEILFNPLQYLNIDCHFTDVIITDLDKEFNNYHIIGDGHPNEKHSKEIAKFLCKEINKRNLD